MANTNFNMNITSEYLRANPNHIFVFGDNLLRKGKGGAAALRDHYNTYGFITKKAPNNREESFYTPEEYIPVYEQEVDRLFDYAKGNPSLFLISPIGAGLANKYGIFDQIIQPNIKDDLSGVENIQFLF